ncbi:MAG: hypothetical protein RLZZ584_1444 [Pseudomonadota bacterium]
MNATPRRPASPSLHLHQYVRQPGVVRRAARLVALVCTAAALAGCGGGSDDRLVNTCTLAEQQAGLRDYMRSWYLFSATMPDPPPGASTTIEDYFDTLLVDTDRWSQVSDSAAFDALLFGGRTLGYGLYVAGQRDDPLPLRVRHVSPGSPAAAAGLVRGTIIDSIDGTDAAVLKASGDFSVLSPRQAGTTLALVVRASAAAAPASASLAATVHDVAPVGAPQVLTSPLGRKVGYVHDLAFIHGAGAALADAFVRFKAAGVQDLVLDLRYNTDGLLHQSRDVASAVGGAAITGRVYAHLAYNSRHGAADTDLHFLAGPLSALDLTRVYVLSGVRTCSAAEALINGLAPHLQVVQIGATTCGKPYGSNPVQACGRTYTAVNFALGNSAGSGGYTGGLAPACAVADDFDHALGAPDEALTAAALQHVDTGACPPATPAASAAAATPARPAATRASRRQVPDDGMPRLDLLP